MISAAESTVSLPCVDRASAPRPLKVAFVVACITTDRAGTEGHLLRLIRSADRRYVDPLLVVLQPSAWSAEFNDPAVPMRVLDFHSFWQPSGWRTIGQLAHILRQERVDLVELHFIDAHVIGALAARRARVPVVISCRRDLGHQYGIKGHFLTRLGNRYVDRFLANSHHVAHWMARLEGIHLDRFDVIPNGVDLEAFDQEARGEPSAEFVEQVRGRQVVMQIANLRTVKNVPMLLRAAQHVVRQIPDVCFVVLGSGEELPRLRHLADQLGVAKHVLWCGSVDYPARYLRFARIGCLTSTAEGLPNALLEYMAAGLPVVATRVGGAAEVVHDRITGHLVPSGDAKRLAERLVELLANPAEAARMGQLGRKRVEMEFSLERQLAQYYAYYHRLAEQAGARAE